MTDTGVSAQSNALYVAFRRLVYRFSEQMSKDECYAIIYIRLYRFKERYKDSSTLEVLSKLEADGAFGPSNPEGLLEIAKDIKRQDLANEVKDFIKKRSKSEKKASLISGIKGTIQHSLFSTSTPGGFDDTTVETEEDLQLRATIEVTLAQATVLMHQVELMERAVAGGKAQRERAKEAISEASLTAAALADRLKHAEIVFGLDSAGPVQPSGSTTVGIPGRSIKSEDQQPIYSNVVYAGESLGTISHSVPVGLSGQYALTPHSELQKQSPKLQYTEVQGKSENLGELAEEQEGKEEDDYEKMYSFAADEEEIKAWRMSLVCPVGNRFPTPPGMQSRRSEVFSSRPPITSPAVPGVPSRTGQQSRPNSYAPNSSHAPSSSQHQKQGNPSTTQSSGVATDARPTYSSRFRGAPNVNSNNSSGDVKPTTHPTHSVQRSSGQAPLHTTSKQLWQDQVSREKDKDSSVKRVAHTLPQPNRTNISPASKSPVLGRRPVSTRSSPHTLKKTNHGSCDIKVNSGSKEIEVRHSAPKETSNVSLVKARLENLKKPSTPCKPVPSPKPTVPVAKPRKNASGTRTFETKSLTQTEATQNKQRVKMAATMPRLSSSTHHSNLSRPQNQEDDAYITLEPGGTSTSTLNTGDSGFEDVRPLQRLDQETSDDGDSNAPIVPLRPGAYTSLLDQGTSIPDHDGYTEVNYMH